MGTVSPPMSGQPGELVNYFSDLTWVGALPGYFIGCRSEGVEMTVDTRRAKENARRRTGQYVESKVEQGNDPVNRFPAERVDHGSPPQTAKRSRIAQCRLIFECNTVDAGISAAAVSHW